MFVHQLFKSDFGEILEHAHKIAFNEIRPKEFDRADYALVVANEFEIFAYATIIEMDKQTAYMQHGGAMPNVKGTTKSKRAYFLMIDWLKRKYKRISTRINNKNISMIKFALSEGLLVDGCFCYPNDVYLSLGWGFSVE